MSPLGLRLWAGFGNGWKWTRVKDVARETLFSRVYEACKEWKAWGGRDRFFERLALVRRVLVKTIEEGWEVGRGPSGKPYSMCCEEELTSLESSRDSFD